MDCDGVLNGYNFWSLLGWKLACLSHSKHIKDWYRKVTDPCGVHESKVKRLAKIIKKTDAKVVMSSSWRGMFWKVPYNEKTYNQTRKEMYEKTKIMVEIVIPELKRFSMNVYKLKSSDWRTPQEIAELEGFELEK